MGHAPILVRQYQSVSRAFQCKFPLENGIAVQYWMMRVWNAGAGTMTANWEMARTPIKALRFPFRSAEARYLQFLLVGNTHVQFSMTGA